MIKSILWVLKKLNYLNIKMFYLVSKIFEYIYKISEMLIYLYYTSHSLCLERYY